jgi:hypothetical protein
VSRALVRGANCSYMACLGRSREGRRESFRGGEGQLVRLTPRQPSTRRGTGSIVQLNECSYLCCTPVAFSAEIRCSAPPLSFVLSPSTWAPFPFPSRSACYSPPELSPHLLHSSPTASAASPSLSRSDYRVVILLHSASSSSWTCRPPNPSPPSRPRTASFTLSSSSRSRTTFTASPTTPRSALSASSWARTTGLRVTTSPILLPVSYTANGGAMRV